MRRSPAIEQRLTRIVAALLLFGASALAFAGCGGSDTEPQASPGPTTQATSALQMTQPTTSTSAPARTVTLYFADADAQELIEETRPTSATGSDLRAALVELAIGPPSGSDVQRALPEGTVIVGTDIRGGEALVNLSDEFIQGYPSGGAAAEFAVLAPLVYTATTVDGVASVRITVNGQTPAPTGSQHDWAGTFSRSDFPDVVGAP